MQETNSTARHPLSTLRRLVRPRERAPDHRCELCGLALAAEHPHLIEPASRQLLCSCDACAVLFSGQSGRLRRVPRDSTLLTGFRLSDAQWEDLRVPINLAFFLQSTPAGRVLALYPSPAGATESLLELEAWHALVADNPILAQLEPDVEALLVNRIATAREYYRAPIDECYKLVGLIRANWRGLSGGAELWDEVGRFFAGLKQRSRHAGGH
jgi:Family of unknown function (DUF5947)